MPKPTFMRKYKDNPVQAIENIIGTLTKDLDIEAARNRLNTTSKDDFVDLFDFKMGADPVIIKSNLKDKLDPQEWTNYKSDLLSRLEKDEKLQSIFNKRHDQINAAERLSAVRDLSALPSLQKLIADTDEGKKARKDIGLRGRYADSKLINAVFFATRSILFPEEPKSKEKKLSDTSSS